MAYLFAGSGVAGASGSGTGEISATFAAGETVLVVLHNDLSATGSTCSDGINTYALVEFNGASPAVALWKADNVAAGTVTITGTITGGGSGFQGISYFRYTGLASGAAQTTNTGQYIGSGSSALDQVTGAAVTPTSQPAMVFGVFGGNGGPATQAGTGFTGRGSIKPSSTGSFAEDGRVTSTAAVTPKGWATPNDAFWTWQTISAVFSESPTSRPNSDIVVSGWTGVPDANLYANIDEATASDADYINSPNLNATPGPATFGLSLSLAAGTYEVRLRCRGTDATGDIRALLLDSSGATVGTSAWQALTGTFATYALSVTTTGTAARVRLEVQ